MLFAVVACPGLWALWAILRISDPDTHVRMALTIAIAVPSLVVGVRALFRREARSLLLVAVFAVMALLFAWVALFVASID